MVASRVSLTYADNVHVPKSGVRSLFRDVVPQRYTVSGLRNTDTESAKIVYVSGAIYELDSSDTTTADDGVLVIVSNDGGRYKLATVKTTSSNVTVRYPSQFAELQDAIDALLLLRFQGSALGIVVVEPGTHSTGSLVNSHPQTSSIRLQAENSVSTLDISDFSGDEATDTAMLRAHYSSVIEVTGSTGILLSNGQGLSNVRDILFVGSGSGSAISVDGTANAVATRCAAVNFSAGYSILNGGYFRGLDCISVHSTQHGVTSRRGGDLRFDRGVFSYNAFSAVSIIQGGTFYFHTCDLSLNGAQAVNSNASGSGRVDNIKVAGTALQRTILTSGSGSMFESGTHTGSPVFSPAVGSLSADGSFTQ